MFFFLLVRKISGFLLVKYFLCILNTSHFLVQRQLFISKKKNRNSEYCLWQPVSHYKSLKMSAGSQISGFPLPNQENISMLIYLGIMHIALVFNSSKYFIQRSQYVFHHPTRNVITILKDFACTYAVLTFGLLAQEECLFIFYAAVRYVLRQFVSRKQLKTVLQSF